MNEHHSLNYQINKFSNSMNLINSIENQIYLAPWTTLLHPLVRSSISDPSCLSHVSNYTGFNIIQGVYITDVCSEMIPI